MGLRVAGIVVGLVASASMVAADDWPRWRGPNLNGISGESAWRANWEEGEPPIVWRAEVGTGFSSIVVARGRLLTMGNVGDEDRVVCLDADSGASVWEHRYASPLDAKFFEGGPTSTPTIDGDRVFTISRRGRLFCLDFATGGVVWERDIAEEEGIPVPGWGFAGSVLVDGDRLLLNVGASGMALEKATGRTIWKSEAAESGYTTPLPAEFGGRRAVIFSSGRDITAVDPANGDVVWSHRWLTRYGVNAADPIVHGEHVFLSSGYEKGATLIRVGSGPEPETVWKSKVMRNQMNPCVLIEGKLYGADGDEGDRPPFKCVDLLTGDEHWAEPGIGACGLVAAAGQLVILSERGELIVAPARSDAFEPGLRMQVLGGKCWTGPVLANGRVYCRNAAGDLACVDLRGSDDRDPGS